MSAPTPPPVSTDRPAFDTDEEVRALHDMVRAMLRLRSAQRARALRYLQERFGDGP